MSTYENVRFSKLGFTFIFDRNMLCLYSDNGDMARRLCGCRAIKTAAKINKGRCASFEHRFSFDGIRYRAAFTPFFEMCYICRVYPEDCYIRYAYSELYNNIADIRTHAAVSVSETDRFAAEILASSDEDKYGSFADGEKERSERIFSVASSVLKMFDSEHIVEYVPVAKCLERTAGIITKNNSLLKKKLVIEIDVRQSVARMNYVLFEAMLSCIARVYYKCMNDGGETVVRIVGKDSGKINVNASYSCDDKLAETLPEYDIKVLKCLSECLGGSAGIVLEENSFSVNVSVPAALSNYYNRIRSSRNDSVDAEEEVSQQLRYSGLFSADPGAGKKFYASSAEYVLDLSAMISDIAMKDIYDTLIV